MRNRRWQPVWEGLESLALKGMSVGCGAGVTTSGEEGFLSDWIAAHATVDRPLVCLDVGANQGDQSTALLRYPESADQAIAVTAFEPSAATFAVLQERFPGSDPRVVTENLAAAGSRGEATLHSNCACSGLASLYQRRLDHFGVSFGPTETVSVTTLDEYCESRGITHVDLLKLDVEGAEIAVLQGTSGLLSSGAIETIQFEFGGCNIDSRTFFQDFWYLLHESYRFFRIVADGLWPISRYEERQERFITTNLVAIQRARLGASR